MNSNVEEQLPKVQRQSFKKLSEAESYAQQYTDSCIFSYEISSGGYRSFIVTSKHDFWQFYIPLKPKFYYEVIRYPQKSKLYLDLEFSVKSNEGKDGYLMTRTLISCVNRKLECYYQCKVDMNDIIILEASTPKKFSLHVIFTTVIFKTNIEIGCFVKKVLSELVPEEKLLFTCLNDAGDSCLFIDQKIYDKNRNFRILFSSKMGKNNPLLVSKIMNNFKCSDSDQELFETFCMSLVTNCPLDATVIQDISFCDQIKNVEACNRLMEFPSSSSRDTLKTVPSSFSVYPEIEELICQSLPHPGRIRECIYYPDVIIFPITGTKYCQIQRRSHRRNNIYYHFNVKLNQLQQRCHSMKCYGCYHSIAIPDSVLDWLKNLEPWSCKNM